MIYIGIDPGKKGGVATIGEDGVKVYQLPTGREWMV